MHKQLGKVEVLEPPEDSKTSPLVVIPYSDFLTKELPQKEELLSPILNSQSLSMVYAPPGIGKTYFLLGLSAAIASGSDFLCWHAPVAAKVLYCDFEMPGGPMQERIAGIIAGMEQQPPSENFHLFTPDLQDPDLPLPDLSTVEGQHQIDKIAEGFDLIIVDNISSAVRTGRENDAECWVVVQSWARKHRAAGRSILFVHHAGKGGSQRGTSKKVDILDLVLQFKRPADYDPSQGARFEIHVEKGRHLYGDSGKAIEATLVNQTDGCLVWSWRTVEDSTFDRVVELTRTGLSQKEISDELEINKSNVSRAIKKAKQQGLLS